MPHRLVSTTAPPREPKLPILLPCKRVSQSSRRRTLPRLHDVSRSREPQLLKLCVQRSSCQRGKRRGGARRSWLQSCFIEALPRLPHLLRWTVGLPTTVELRLSPQPLAQLYRLRLQQTCAPGNGPHRALRRVTARQTPSPTPQANSLHLCSVHLERVLPLQRRLNEKRLPLGRPQSLLRAPLPPLQTFS